MKENLEAHLKTAHDQVKNMAQERPDSYVRSFFSGNKGVIILIDPVNKEGFVWEISPDRLSDTGYSHKMSGPHQARILRDSNVSESKL